MTGLDQPLRFGLVGLGNWGTKLARTAAAVEGVELALCFSRSEERRAAFAAAQGCAAAGSLEEMAAAGLDGVLIATPHTTHVDLVEGFATAGCNVMVEKPLALNVVDARRCIAAAEGAGVVLQVAHFRRRLLATRAVKQMIDDGTLGALHLVEGHFTRQWGVAVDRPWRDDPAEAPAGGMTALGVHMADNMLYFAGPAVRLSAFSTRIGKLAPIDDMTGALIEFENGAVGTLTTSVRLPKLITCGAHGTGLAAWSEADGTRLVTLTGNDDVRTERELPPLDPVADNMAAFADAIRRGSPPETGGAAGLAVVEILEAMALSAADNGAVVELASLR